MKRKQWSESKVPRTRGWLSQPEFDNLLADLDVSSLRFLKHGYNKQIRDFGYHKDLHDEENAKEYQRLLQRKRMITEELEHREMDLMATPKYFEGDTYFDSETGLVINTERGPLYSIAFNEDETDYVYDKDTEEEDDKIKMVTIRAGNKVVGHYYNSDRDKSSIINISN